MGDLNPAQLWTIRKWIKPRMHARKTDQSFKAMISLTAAVIKSS
jgi:hypothetical protein